MSGGNVALGGCDTHMIAVLRITPYIALAACVWAIGTATWIATQICFRILATRGAAVRGCHTNCVISCGLAPNIALLASVSAKGTSSL